MLYFSFMNGKEFVLLMIQTCMRQRQDYYPQQKVTFYLILIQKEKLLHKKKKGLHHQGSQIFFQGQ